MPVGFVIAPASYTILAKTEDPCMDCSKTAEFLKALRKAKGLTQQDAADALFLSPKTISRWESGDGLPDINIIQSVADLYDVSVDEILRGERKSVADAAETIKNDKIKNKRSRKALEAKMYKGFWIFEIITLSAAVTLFLVGFIVGASGTRANTIVGIILAGAALAAGIATHLIGRYAMSPRIDEDDEDIMKEAKTNVFDKIRKDDFVMNMVYLSMLVLIIGAIALLFLPLDVFERVMFVVFGVAAAVAFDLPVALAWRNKGNVRKALSMGTAFAALACFLAAIHIGIDWWPKDSYEALYRLIGPYTGGGLGMAMSIIGCIVEVAAIALAIWKKWVLPMAGSAVLLVLSRIMIEVPVEPGKTDVGGLGFLYFLFIIFFGIFAFVSLLTRTISIIKARKAKEESSNE